MAFSASPSKPGLPFGFLVIPLLIARPSLDNIFGLLRFSAGGASLSPGFLFNVVIVSVAAALAGHAMLVERARQSAFVTVLGIWGPFLLSSAIAAFYSPVPVEALQMLFNFVTYGAVAFLGLIYGAALSRSALTGIVALTGVVPTVYGLSQVVFGMADTRLASTFAHPNILAFFCVIYISYLFHAQLSGYVRSRWAVASIWALVATAAISLLFTGTRSAYIATLFFLFCYAGVRRPLLLIPLLMLSAVALLIPAVSDRIIDAVSGSSSVSYDYFVSAMRGEVIDAGALTLDSGTWRKYLWQAAWPWIDRQPIFGHGLGSFQFYSTSFFPLASGGGNPAHNVYVQLLFEGGCVLLLSFFYLLVRIFFRLGKCKTENRYDAVFAYLFMTIFMIVSLSDNMLYYLTVNIFIWFVIFCIMGQKIEVRQSGRFRQKSMAVAHQLKTDTR